MGNYNPDSYRPEREALENVEVFQIPEDVTHISENAFANQKSLRKVILPKNLGSIENGAFKGCSALEKIDMSALASNRSFKAIWSSAFADCVSLKEFHIPHIGSIGRRVFEGSGLEKVTIDGVYSIESYAFSGCKHLKEVHIPNPDEIHYLHDNAFEGCPDDWEYVLGNGIHIPHAHLDFTISLSDGLNVAQCFKIADAAQDILQDKTFSPILTRKLCNAQHRGQLGKTVEKYKNDFQTIGFYDISNQVDAGTKEQLIQLFKNNTASHGVVPKIIDALTIAATTLNIEPERIVKSFEDKKFRDAIIAMRSCHEGNHFFDCEAALFAMTFDVNTVKQFILENPHKDYASVLLCRSYLENDERLLDAARWIVMHPNTNSDIIEQVYTNVSDLNIAPGMTVDQITAQLSTEEAQSEINLIHDKYGDRGFSFYECVCNLPKTEVELGKYRAYIMDAQDPRQVMLGYDTNCCQHLDGAGETAMMYGLANPDAGFFVIEDKETGKILAQAEVWSSKCGPQPDEDRVFYTGGYDDYIEADNSVLACVEYDYIMAHSDPEDFLLNTLGLCKEESENGHAEYYMEDENVLCLTDDDKDRYYITPDGPIWLCELISKNPLMREDFNLCLQDMRLGADGLMHELPDEDAEPVLVFDNIEFANDRQIDQFAPIIAKWCEASPYQNIIMGNGYNAMENDGLRKAEPVVLPMDQEWLRLMDDEQEIEKMNEKKGTDFVIADDAYNLLAHPYVDPTTDAIDIDDFSPYTDADESCSALKVDGRIEPYLEKMYGEYCNQHPEEQTIAVPKKEEKAEKKKSAYRGR